MKQTLKTLGLLGAGTFAGVCLKDSLDSLSYRFSLSDSFVGNSAALVLQAPIALGYVVDDTLFPFEPETRTFQRTQVPSKEKNGYIWDISFNCPDLTVQDSLCYSQENIHFVNLQDPSFHIIRRFTQHGCEEQEDSCYPLDERIQKEAFTAYERSKVDFYP